ncbi:Cleft lip and palate transmembrane protein 1 [Pseudolycoriella hygida]|uniref:Cleft lip and palate transmembrane protein 1 n=1 Tax=Pseudolycoriella hygida TaxID=35572 RepID=A0A9Q0N960_9DIPT|nr:Cleft lip and palate transmembrane protein 1 [Pseudolycoriella hygida]
MSSSGQNETVNSSSGSSESDNLVAQDGAVPNQQRQPTQLESFFAITKSLIIRALIIYFISSFFRRPSGTSVQSGKDGTVGVDTRVPAWNLFDNGTIFDLHVYLSEDFDFVNFDDPQSLCWFQESLVYGDWWSGSNGDGSYTHECSIRASPSLQNNGSLYLHAYVTKYGMSPNPKSGSAFAGKNLGYIRRQLNKFKKIRFTKTHNLLTGETSKSEEEIRKSQIMSNEIISHWHPNLTLNLVTDQTNWVRGSVPQPLDEYVTFDVSGKTYFPILFANDYWNMLRDYQPINSTIKTLDLYLTFQPLSMFKWQLYAAQAMKNKWTSNILGDAFAGGEEQDEDQDSIKETLLETNPYLLGLTILISILHSVFELLAFKNDIQFWNNRKSLEGLSVRSVFFGVFQSLIVLLYVLDNETNFMIRVSCFIGLGIEVWKIQKVVDLKLNKEDRWFGVIPRIVVSDKGSYVESSTKVYDNLAFKYLGWLCFPLLIGYGIYSVYYNEHKGWYSFVLNMLYGFLLTFGFIMMTPQLFINYKMKSVAHLPWRMMTYKFLNTFIDDIFAFVIKMPTMYRLGCFRDDIVFFIFLYQRWIYKVDHKRVNEFGFSKEMEDEAAKKVALQTEPGEQATVKSDRDKKTE